MGKGTCTLIVTKSTCICIDMFLNANLSDVILLFFADCPTVICTWLTILSVGISSLSIVDDEYIGVM